MSIILKGGIQRQGTDNCPACIERNRAIRDHDIVGDPSAVVGHYRACIWEAGTPILAITPISVAVGPNSNYLAMSRETKKHDEKERYCYLLESHITPSLRPRISED